MAKVAPAAAWSCVFFLLAASAQGAVQGKAYATVVPDPGKPPAQTSAPTDPPTQEEDKPDKEGKYRRHRSHHHHHLHATTVVLPSGFVPITFGDQVYYYSQGVFYQLINQDLFLAPAPVGIEVSSIPTLRERVEVDGQYYNLVNGIYYQIMPDGKYRVVIPPSSAAPADN